MKKYLESLKLLIMLLALSSYSYGQTYVNDGYITSNTTWTKSNSPYIVTSNIVVFEDVTLTIEHGVTVKFGDGVSMELRNGKLVAIGTVEDSIVFTSNSINPTKESWKGINVIGTKYIGSGNQIRLKYFTGMYSSALFDMDVAYSIPYYFNNCTFINNKEVFSEYGLENDAVIITSSEFYDNDLCIGKGLGYNVIESEFFNNSQGVNGVTYLDNCHFSGHSSYAIIPGVTTQNCTFENNKVAVSKAMFSSYALIFINNIVKNNQVGIEMYSFFPEVNFSGNVICNNSIFNIKRTYNTNTADLNNNCWCTTNSEEIEDKIWDAKDDINLGLIKTSPNYCIKDFGSISGIVHVGNENFDVLIKAINKETLKSYSFHVDANGEFSIDSLPKGKYIVTAIPASSKFNSTYYPNKIKESEAAILNVAGDIIDVDIYLQQITGIDSPTNNDIGLNIFPNPFSDKLKVLSSSEFEVRDLSGNILYRGNGTDIEIDTYDWKPGMYFLITKEGSSRKILKMR